MGVNSLSKTVTRQRGGCDFNSGPTAPESNTLTTRLPSNLLNGTRELFAHHLDNIDDCAVYPDASAKSHLEILKAKHSRMISAIKNC